MLNIFKKGEKQKNANEDKLDDYEEISEKRTSKLGYILLILMVIFIVSISQGIFSDLRKIPEKPQSPAYCISSIVKSKSLNTISYLGICKFNEIDKMFKLDTQYSAISSQINQITSLNSQISSHQNSIRAKEREVEKLNKNYDLSLQEKIANEQAIMDKYGIKGDIVKNQFDISSTNQQIISLENQRNLIVSQISPQVQNLNLSYDEAYKYYQNKSDYYQLKIFLLMLLFVLPFFLVSVYFYFKLKKKNSPYAIIFTAVLGASAILLLQVVFRFLYEILPREWFARIFAFFMETPFLRYILYYGAVILTIALFGGLVYFIQKKVFNPSKVAIRRLKDGKCPGCSFSLNPDHNFCPKCGQQIKEKCLKCGNAKIHYLSHCPNCGKK